MSIKQESTRTIEKMDLVFHLSWSDIKARYARSILGPFWLVLTTAIGVAGLGYIWSILFNMDKETFIPSLGIGLVIWQFLSTCIIEAPHVFPANSAVIRNTLNPILIFPFNTILRNLIIFAHNSLIIIVLLIIYPPNININTLLIIPGFLLVIGNMGWIVPLIALLGARYRDLAPAIASFIIILFFLSPVIYKPEQLGIKAKFLWCNPFTYLISMIRDPVTGCASPLFAYVVMIVALILGWLLLIFTMKKYQHRLIYWI